MVSEDVGIEAFQFLPDPARPPVHGEDGGLAVVRAAHGMVGVMDILISLGAAISALWIILGVARELREDLEKRSK